MKRIITLCLFSMLTIHAQAQKTITVTKLAGLPQAILAKQLQAETHLKTTATSKRLIGYSRYDGNTVVDSAYHKYRAMMGSNLTTYFSYRGLDFYTESSYFDPALPFSYQHIQSDTSVYFMHDGSALAQYAKLTFDYDAKRNLIYSMHEMPYETFERFITVNSSGMRETLIERDSLDGSQPYVDRTKHLYSYNMQGRMIRDSLYHIPLSTPTGNVVYTYDNAGNLLSAIEYDLSMPPVKYSGWEFSYDGSNRLTQATEYNDLMPGWTAINRYSYTYTGSGQQYTKMVEQTVNLSTYLLEDNFGEIIELNSGGQMARRYWLDDGASALDTIEMFDLTYNAAGLLEQSQGAKYLGGGNYGPQDQVEHFYYEDYQTSGIIESEKGQSLIYPIPATNYLYVETLPLGKQVSIIDLTGRTIKQVKVTERPQAIDVSELPNGSYFLRYDNQIKQFNIIH